MNGKTRCNKKKLKLKNHKSIQKQINRVIMEKKNRKVVRKIQEFFRRKGVQPSFQLYGIEVLGKMAIGLFASLLIGTILNSLGGLLSWPFLTQTIWPAARDMTGPCIAAAIAMALKAPQLVLFASLIPGYYANQLGGPVGVLVATLFCVEIGKLISGETPLDIVLTPAIVILVGCGIAYFLASPLAMMMTQLGRLIMAATALRPVFMGVVVSVLVGMILTLPISSAALCMMLSLSGLAAGAATAGCCAQMIGFAVISYRDNGVKGLLAQGLGTSMLQIPNILKNWKIWIPPTVASAITGPLATTVFAMENSPLGAGMGTAGLVGWIETMRTMSQNGEWSVVFLKLCLVDGVLPALISFVLYSVMRKKRWIADGDMVLPK